MEEVDPNIIKERQSLLDTMLKGLASQDWLQSYSNQGGSLGGCLYRGPDNCKCAVGHLIPDTAYVKAMDMDDVGLAFVADRLWTNGHKALANMFRVHEEFLGAIQEWHDDHLEPGCDNSLEAWNALKHTANRYEVKLKAPSYYKRVS